MGVAGELTLGWSMLTMAVVTCGSMLVAVQRSGGLPAGDHALRAVALLRMTGRLLGRTVIYLAVNALFIVTLAFASHSTTGDTTVLSYAYLFCSYLVAGTGMALGMSRIADMSRASGEERRATIVATVPAGFRYALLIVAPALALLVVGGAPLVHAVLPGSLDAAGVRSLQVFTLLLVPWTAAALLVSLLMPAMLALDRAVMLNALAAPLVALHVVATLVGNALFGVEGSVGAMWVAPTCFAAIMVVCLAGSQSGRVLRETAGGSLRFLGLAAAAYGAAAAITAAVPSTAAAAAASVLGTVLYLGGALLVARSQLGLLAGRARAHAPPEGSSASRPRSRDRGRGRTRRRARRLSTRSRTGPPRRRARVATVPRTSMSGALRRQFHHRSPRPTDRTPRRAERRDGHSTSTAPGGGPRRTPHDVQDLQAQMAARHDVGARRARDAHGHPEDIRDRERRIVQPAVPRQGKAPGPAAVQADEPRAAVAVAEELQRERAPPAGLAQQGLAAIEQVLVGRHGAVGARTGSGRVGHPHRGLRAPRVETGLRREAADELGASPQAAAGPGASPVRPTRRRRARARPGAGSERCASASGAPQPRRRSARGAG